jgi:hypothetical protein
MGMFDDLLPSSGGGNTFDDLIPAKQPQPVAAKPEEDLTKPAFLTPKQPAKALKEVQTAAVEERNKPKFDYQELYTNPDLFKIVQDYSKASTGAVYKEGEDKEKFTANFMTNLRGQDWNTFSNIAYLNKLKNAPMEDKEKLALGRRLFDQVKDATEAGGQPGARPFYDMASSALTDLTNYVGLGVATLGKKAVTKAATTTALQQAEKSIAAKALTPTTAKVVGATTAVEGTIGAGQNVLQQKSQQEVSKALGEKPSDLDYTQVGAAALLSAVFGFGEAKGTAAMKPAQSGTEKLNEILKSKVKAPADPNAPPTAVERVLTDPVQENMDTVVEEFMNIQGGRILDDINPATPLTDAKVQKDLSGRAVRVALYVMEQDPTFRVKPGQKTSTAIAEVFSNLDKVDDVALEQAIRKEGLTPEEFAQANKLTVTEAAQVMQQYSAAAKAMSRLSQIDPAFKEQADLLFGKPDEYTSALGRVGQMVSTVERESKAWVVSGIGTTVRNIIGTGVGLTYNSAASLIEGSLYTVGRTAAAAVNPGGLGIKDTFKKGVSDTMKDAFGVYGQLLRSDLSAATTDTLLQHNPALRNNILSATQENATNDISKVAKLFNSLNVAQDAFFRRAIFNASVDKNMRKLGLDMYETVAEGKTIPASILKEATDDTLKATFSYTPKQQKHGIKSFEAGAEGLGNLFVKAAEFPGGSLLATFPRFMSNAIAFQYRYSVFGGASGVSDVLAGSKKLAAGDETGRALVNKGMENFSKGVVGTAALAAAYDYRLNNQDTEWYNFKTEDGTTVDTRAIFPLGPTLAVADFMAKRKQGLEPKTAEMVESIVGMKMPAGTQNQFLDQVFAAFSSEKEADKMEIAVGKVLGDFTARFSQPFLFKSAYEFFDLFREEGTIQRDPNVIKAQESGDRFIEAAVNRVQSKLPVVKEQLPAAVPRLREGPVYKEGEFFNSLIGVREATEKSPVEQEITRLGIDPYRLYGPSSGDREYDRAFVEAANPMVIKTIQRVMANERYQALPIAEQKVALANTVRDITSIARDKTDAKFTAQDLDRVKKMRFDKLSGEVRKVINDRYAKDHDGVTLEQAKDYRAVDKYEAMMGNLQFAAGGLVPAFAGGGLAAAKAVGKTAIKAASESVLDTAKRLGGAAADVADTEIDSIINKNLGVKATPAPSPVMEQMTNVLSKPKAVPKPLLPATPAKAPAALPTEEAIPTLTTQAIEAPAPSKAFADEDYVKGEELMKENYDEAFLKSWKIANPEDYENTLHSYTGQAKGLKYSEMPPVPFAKKIDESAESLVDEVVYDIDGNPIVIGQKPAPVKEVVDDYYGVDEKYLSGDMNAVAGKNNIARRNDTISAIKEKREDTFFKLRNNTKFADIDDDVLGVVLGDYRYSRGVEINAKDSTMLDDVVKMAGQYQKRLDALREKYKDVPPVKLFHGQNVEEDINKLKREGFKDPSKLDYFHSEMMVGAPSFTKDLNLGFRGGPFGGTSPEKYVVTEIPYADYVFNKINMAPEKYDNKDLNTILRAVTGAPGVVRPVGLPRAGFLETEDMMVEAEKLRVKGKSATLRGAETDISEALQRGGKDVIRSEVKKNEEIVSEYMKQARQSSDPKERMKLAYMSYGGIKDLMNSYLGMGKVTSTKTGLGQQYQAAMNHLADYTGIQRQMREVGDILWDGGAKQKAQNLYELSDKLKKFQQSEPAISTAADEAKRVKPLDEVRKFVPKLAKGGLATRR